ncbi:hypothetical protein FSP39_013007 [Pinctada imbricata]|uniref:Adenine phosphoribosyltransferase n=1 Tax=Pinctada imbricata TaxID=66713 RepID=A0AA89BKM2_PINIB|nr:hypothetical protein FSP39_013007 [Pinctada imbricata]
MADERLSRVKGAVRGFPDFPKPGILFRDIFPILRDPSLLKDLCSLMLDHIRSKTSEVDVIVGLEARGFLFGPILAMELGCSFVPIRKAGKLPGKTEKVEYILEYGKDVFEIQEGSILKGQKVVIVDDLLATGGTMKAACELVKKVGGDIKDCLVVIELSDLKGRDKVPEGCSSLINY